MKPTKDYWNFTARSELRFSFLMTMALLWGFLIWLRHLGGWTVTIHRNHEPFFVLKEWW